MHHKSSSRSKKSVAGKEGFIYAALAILIVAGGLLLSNLNFSTSEVEKLSLAAEGSSASGLFLKQSGSQSLLIATVGSRPYDPDSELPIFNGGQKIVVAANNLDCKGRFTLKKDCWGPFCTDYWDGPYNVHGGISIVKGSCNSKDFQNAAVEKNIMGTGCQSLFLKGGCNLFGCWVGDSVGGSKAKILSEDDIYRVSGYKERPPGTGENKEVKGYCTGKYAVTVNVMSGKSYGEIIDSVNFGTAHPNDGDLGKAITLPTEAGTYCITAGCEDFNKFMGADSYDVYAPSATGPHFTNLKAQIEIADLGDPSTLEQSSTINHGISCGKQRYCPLYANECVWNNPSGPGLCRKSGGTTTTSTTTTTTLPSVPQDTTKPSIYTVLAPDQIYADDSTSFVFSISEDQSDLDSITRQIVGMDSSKCVTTSSSGEGTKSQTRTIICSPSSSDAGKTFTLKITATSAGGTETFEKSVSVVSKPPPEPDIKAPKCNVNIYGDPNVAPTSAGKVTLSCIDNYRTDDDAGDLSTIEVVVESKQTGYAKLVATFGSNEEPLSQTYANFYEDFVSCDANCRAGIYGMAGVDQQGKEFRFKVTAKDTSGNSGEFYSNYFRVSDVTQPTCQIYYSTAGDLNSEKKVQAGGTQNVKVKCNDNLAMGPAYIHRDYTKSDSSSVWDEEGAKITLTAGQEFSYTIAVPSDAKQGTVVLWYLTAEDADGNTADMQDYGVITVKDTTPPTITEVTTSGATVFDGGKFSVAVKANDNVNLGSLKIQAKKKSETTYSDVQTISLSSAYLWGYPPVQITNTWYDAKKGDLNAAPSDFDWKIILTDADGNSAQAGVQTSGSFKLKKPCNQAERKDITYSDLTISPMRSDNVPEFAPNEEITVSAKFKNNYGAGVAECGGLTASTLKYNASVIVDNSIKLWQGTTPSLGTESASFKIKIPEPRLPKQGGFFIIGASGVGLITGGALTVIEDGGYNTGVDTGAGSVVGGFLDRGSSFGSGAPILLPGDIVSWKLHASDRSGNTVETGDRYFKIKDIEAPSLRVDGLPLKVSSGKSYPLNACSRDWNRYPAKLKNEIYEKDYGRVQHPSGIRTLTKVGGLEDCYAFGATVPSGVKENKEISFIVEATDAVGNKTTVEKKALVANPPEWTEDRTPKIAKPNQKILFSKYWKDDTSIKSAELWVDLGSGLQKVDSVDFALPAQSQGGSTASAISEPLQEGWINFNYKVPKIAGLEKIKWEMRVTDIYGNIGVVDPEVNVTSDANPPEISDVSQAANEIYKGWANYLKFKAKDDVELKSATLYVEEPEDQDFKIFGSIELSGNETSSQLEWKNENLKAGDVQWYISVTDINDNVAKTDVKKFIVKLEEAPQGIVAPTTSSTTTSTTTTLAKLERPKITGTTEAAKGGGQEFILLAAIAILIILAAVAYKFRDKIKNAFGGKPAVSTASPPQEQKTDGGKADGGRKSRRKS